MRDKLLNQKGITLLELMVAIGIMSFIIAGATVAILQLFAVSDRNSDHMTAYAQVQNAGFSVSRDTLQAESVSDVDDGETPESELLTLDWVDFEGDDHRVTYTLEDASAGLKELWRSYSINDVAQETIMVAKYIDPGTSCTWDGTENVLTLVVIAKVGGQSATRTYNVEPRPLS